MMKRERGSSKKRKKKRLFKNMCNNISYIMRNTRMMGCEKKIPQKTNVNIQNKFVRNMWSDGFLGVRKQASPTPSFVLLLVV